MQGAVVFMAGWVWVARCFNGIEHRIGFAYVPTALNPIDLFNERGKSYQRAMLRCVEAIITP